MQSIETKGNSSDIPTLGQLYQRRFSFDRRGGPTLSRGRRLWLLDHLVIPAAMVTGSASARAMRAVLRAIDSHARNQASCAVRVGVLAAKCEYSESMIRRAIGALRRADVLIVQAQTVGGQGANRYQIAWSNLLDWGPDREADAGLPTPQERPGSLPGPGGHSARARMGGEREHPPGTPGENANSAPATGGPPKSNRIEGTVIDRKPTGRDHHLPLVVRDWLVKQTRAGEQAAADALRRGCTAAQVIGLCRRWNAQREDVGPGWLVAGLRKLVPDGAPAEHAGDLQPVGAESPARAAGGGGAGAGAGRSTAPCGLSRYEVHKYGRQQGWSRDKIEHVLGCLEQRGELRDP